MNIKNLVVALFAVVLTVGCTKSPAEQAKAEARQLREAAQASDLLNAVVAQEISCGDAVAQERIFDRKTGVPRVYVWVDKAEKLIHCYDGQGHHPVWGDELIEITKAHAKVIKDNAGNCYPVTPPKCCTAPPAQPSAPAPVQPPPPPPAALAPTPLPELGTSPCCGRQ